MRRQVLEVELAGVGSVVRAPGVRGLVKRVTGRPPVYVSVIRGYSIQEHTAADVIAFAERMGYDVVITGPRCAAVGVPVVERLDVDHPAFEPEPSLW